MKEEKGQVGRVQNVVIGLLVIVVIVSSITSYSIGTSINNLAKETDELNERLETLESVIAGLDDKVTESAEMINALLEAQVGELAPYIEVISLSVPEAEVAGKPYRIEATVKSTSDFPRTGTVKLLSGMEIIGSKFITLNPNEEKTIVFDVTKDPGKHKITLKDVEDYIYVLPPPPASGKMTLMTGWALGWARASEDEIIKVFNKYYPNVEVEVEALPTGAIFTALAGRVAAGNPPDFLHWNSGYFLKEFVEEGLLLDITDMWEKYGWAEVLSPLFVEVSKPLGYRYYGLPMASVNRNWLHWNKRFFEETGVKEPPYETWEELFNVLDQLKDEVDVPPWYAAWGGPKPWIMERFGWYQTATAGIEAHWRMINGEATAGDFREPLELITELLEYSNTGVLGLNNLFDPPKALAGELTVMTVAMAPSWSWYEAENKELGVHFGRHKLPGNFDINHMWSPSYLLFADADAIDAARCFIAASILPTAQRECEKIKGLEPNRIDMEVTLEQGYPPVTVQAYEFSTKEDAKFTGVAALTMPMIVTEEYGAIIQEYIGGEITLDAAVDKLLDSQEKLQDEFIRKWDFR